MQKHILVTGGAGYIGSAVTAALIAQGDTVVVLDDLSAGQQDKVPAQATFVSGSTLDEASLSELFSREQFDAVVHCAAKKAVGESESRPEYYFKHNVVGTLNLLTAMAEHVVPKIVFSSTAAVYAPNESSVPLTEDSPLAPASVYGQSKLLAEVLIREFARTGKISEYAILRYFNVAGDAGLSFREDAAQNVFPHLARSVFEGTPFRLFGTDYETKDGTGVRDYIHLTDLVEAHQRALSVTASDTFNLGTGAGYSVRELVAAFETSTGTALPVVEEPRRAGDVAVVLADASHARAVLGWEPKRTLKEMVDSTIAVYKPK